MKSLAYRLLCGCLKDNDLAASAIKGGSLSDWESALQVATDELILPLLYSRIKQLELGSSVPPEILDALSAVEGLNEKRNRCILGELKLVATLLNKVGVEPVLLKGVAYLAMGVYPNRATRYLCDIDLLLSEAQLRPAVDILAANGFQADTTDRVGYFRHHHPPVRRTGSVFIEIHHSLSLAKSASLLPAHELIARSVPFDFDGARVRVPCPADLFTHLVLHSQIQHSYHERIWPPLRTMYDLHLVVRRFRSEIDWNCVQDRFRKAGEFGTLALHLRQAGESLGVDPPFQFKVRGLMRLRWLRRKLLRRMPALRYVDPLYMFSTIAQRRLRLLRHMLGRPEGLRSFLRQVLTFGVYRRLGLDIVEGRGR